ncbi:hypothetical protein EU99_1094 [Prochlorococcus marinus str. MIT 9321]|uniref:Uncharacterized protein n=1 Tax=Prochlorococcus marinus str. MIT 9401 TaxID=167551 RepID=A0A0A2B3X6_PROMR|nr:hypothetical protein [Prochlorococcus marinus]KGG03509.1 hypothetical protein EU99_1094 [Prochlorococcus marinus str. MIT 9321]KGG04650.1 hypothetical protein EV00_1682 [Prochlorococcus marinus str. MIT 9322]KGG07334.1 hypothetical protein EV01_1671 [Prochlorococcus marinus str. MIT 9401]
MKNNFIENINDKKYFYSLIEDIENSKVGFYSVGLYPASLAYNCAMHGKSNNILLAPRKDRDLLGAFSNDVISDMDNETIEKIKIMGQYCLEGKRNSFDLKDLLLECEIVILASNSNHIQDDVKYALELRKNLKRENVVLGCLVGSFCIDNKNKKPFILCNKYPNLAFFTGFHRHGALRNPNDSFTANFCHPDALTALIGARILNQLSPKIQVSPGVHNIECQYIKSIKNISSIFAGFVNNFHSDKPGMLPSINTILLTQCLDQAASVSLQVRKENKLENKYLSLKELGYGEEKISAREIINDKFCEKGDYTFSQLNAVKADVLGSMTLPTEGKPTRNFQAGQVLSDMLLQLNRCPKDISEFVNWCNKYSLSQGGLEGLKSLKFWPDIYKEFKIKNNTCSMINLIYLCFNANPEEKKEIYKVLISSEEITNFCQESVKSELSLELIEKLKGEYLFNDIEILHKKLFSDKEENDLKEKESSNLISKKNPSYINVLKIINHYFYN